MHQLYRKSPRTQSEKLDKYYTKKKVVKDCLNTLDMNRYDLIIEPAAGNGNFLHEISHPNIIGIDIEPESEGIIKQDWFSFKIPEIYLSVLVVGNPPFGRYHSMSRRFIEHALQFFNLKTLAFILPNVYRKHTRQAIIPGEFRIKEILSLDKDAFLLNGKEYHIPSSFFVFDRSTGPDLRTPSLNHLKETKDFVFGNPKDYDIFVFGAAPKKITQEAKPNNRGYYLKSKIGTQKLINRLQKIDWKGNSSAQGGVYWLNKTEFLSQYQTHYDIT
ncbi:MAG: hypothetical protein OXB93_05610 [Cytophagales bacterium]|nr:hypothetical protein [Cytophagales bacterium]